MVVAAVEQDKDKRKRKLLWDYLQTIKSFAQNAKYLEKTFCSNIKTSIGWTSFIFEELIRYEFFEDLYIIERCNK